SKAGSLQWPRRQACVVHAVHRIRSALRLDSASEGLAYNVGVKPASLGLAACAFAFAFSLSVRGATLDETSKPGGNYATAEFRLWHPETDGAIRAIVVLMPGSNGDARAMVEDPVWRAFATKHKLALLGCHITDKPHPQNFIEDYANVSQGSGDALLSAIDAIASRARHPELSR